MNMRQRLPRMVFSIMLFIVFSLLFLVCAGMAYQSFGAARDAKMFPPPGQMVDVGGHRLHLWKRGEGSPVVLFDAGSGGTVFDWGLVAGEVSETTTTVVYDRAGMGWSDPGPEPRNTEHMIAELWTALEIAGIEGPYILVGHSFGGINMRAFYHAHPEQVVGMVLVDSAHEEQLERFSSEIREMGKANQRVMRLYGVAARLGIVRGTALFMGTALLPPTHHALPEQDQKALLNLVLKPQSFETIRKETHAAEKRMANLQEGHGSLGSLPLTVISAGKGFSAEQFPPGFPLDEMRKTWNEMQAELAALSTQATHRIAEESSHYIQLEQPDLVIEAIREMVFQVGRNEPVPRQNFPDRKN